MKDKRKPAIVAAAAIAALAVGGAAIAGATGGGDDDEPQKPITGQALDSATAAALEHTGGGRVTGTEVGDEESAYEVEVTRADGGQLDVQLDEAFNVVGQAADDDNDQAGDSDGEDEDER
jgi:hypothetical protein